MYRLMICLSVGMMLGRVMAVDAVDRTGLKKDRLNRIADELDRKKKELQQQGLQPEALTGELTRIEAKLRRDAQLRRPFLSANDRSRWCTVRALVEAVPMLAAPAALALRRAWSAWPAWAALALLTVAGVAAQAPVLLLGADGRQAAWSHANPWAGVLVAALAVAAGARALFLAGRHERLASHPHI